VSGSAAPRNSSLETPRIYVASLADYNAGRLHGVWLDAVDADAVYEGIARMLRASPEPLAEEFAIHDFENFGSYRVDEYDGIHLVCAVGAAIDEIGTLFAEYLGHVGGPKTSDDVAPLVERFRESYQGEWDSMASWAESFLEDTGSLKDVPESLRNYIDFESWADDAEMNGDVFSIEVGGRTHVFWSH
jgi:antirestriction protein